MFKNKNKNLVLIVLIIAMSVLANGCTKKVPENVVATVNEVNIEREAFDKEYNIQANAIQNQLGEGVLDQVVEEGKTFKDKLKEETLDRLVLEELITQDAAEKKIEVSDEEIDKSIEDIKQSLRGEEELETFLKDLGMDKEFLREYNKKNILIQKHKADFIENVDLKDEEAEEFFKEHKEDLIVVKARHILVESEEEGKEVLKKLKDGEDFGKLVIANSKDSDTAATGGELGYFSKGHNPEEFDNVVFTLKEGEISPLIKTEVGYHIVEMQERKDTFESLKPELTNLIKENKYVEYVEKLQKDATIETYLPEEVKEDKKEDKKDETEEIEAPEEENK